MALPVVYGQTLVDELEIRLGGLSNAFTLEEQLSFLNEGKDAVWGVLYSLDLDFAGEDSQAVTSGDDDYFADLTTTAREYNLPLNCREIRFIECTTDGYEYLQFDQKHISDREFQNARRVATDQGSSAESFSDTLLYTVFGRRTLMFAQYPPAAIRVKIWYIKALDDLDIASELTDIIHPFWRKIVDYAAERATLSLSEKQLSREWMDRWRGDVRELAISSGPRASTAPNFIEDYLG